MCTVTYIPTEQGCTITSSRDENALRPKATAPAIYEHNGTGILYPKDAKANGSWIACTQTGNAAVLLNGAFVKHVPAPPYRKSRGLVFLEIISHPHPWSYFLKMDLTGIEPFTLVLYLAGCLFEARWDGKQKHCTRLNRTVAHIWSSATLYTATVARQRKHWLEKWLQQYQHPTISSMINFHRFAGDGDSSNSVLMNRDNKMRTVSITGTDIRKDAFTMQYYDPANNTYAVQSLQIKTAPVLQQTIQHV